MNSDELLSQFRSDIPVPDEATARRIYAAATSTRRRQPSRRLVLVLVFAAGAAIAAVALRGGDTGRGPVAATGQQSNGNSMRVTFSHNDGVLSSVGLTVSLEIANARVQLQVLHSDAPSIDLYRGKGSREVVFQSQVSTTDTPPAALFGPTGPPNGVAPPEPGYSFWSGTLSPSDWNGGCQTGLYEITYLVPGGGFGGSEWFRCRDG